MKFASQSQRILRAYFRAKIKQWEEEEIIGATPRCAVGHVQFTLHVFGGKENTHLDDERMLTQIKEQLC